MNFKEAGEMRALLERINSMELRIKDLERRADDSSKAHRLLLDSLESKTLTLKKASNG